MVKPNLLSRAAEVAASLGREPDRPAPPPKPAPAPSPVPEPATEATPAARTSREGKRFLGFYVEPLQHEEIKQAALDEGLQIQELLRQAVDEWMERNGAEAVAAVARRRERKRAASR